MKQYAGLDVSLKAVSICVSDGAGSVVWRGDVEFAWIATRPLGARDDEGGGTASLREVQRRSNPGL